VTPPPWVLAVDDDADIRVMLRIALELNGVHVRTVGTGDELLAALARPPLPAVVLVDLMLPGLRGTELVARIKSTSGLEGLPILVLSGSARAADEARQLGAVGCLPKPVELSDLLGAIAPFVSRGGDAAA
jgi:CheY-like chemotaxis protein